MAAPALTPAHQPEAARPMPQPVAAMAASVARQPMEDDVETDPSRAVRSGGHRGRDRGRGYASRRSAAARLSSAGRAAAAMIRSAPAAIEEDPSVFVAPRPRAAGQPSPEALARLQAAVARPAAGRAPKFAAVRRQCRSAASPAAAAPCRGQAALWHRVADQPDGRSSGSRKRTPRPASGRAQPPVTAYEDDHDMGADQDRIEIPAFLRRQAN